MSAGLSHRTRLRRGRTATPCPVWCLSDHAANDEVDGPCSHDSASELIHLEDGESLTLFLTVSGYAAPDTVPSIHLADIGVDMPLDQLLDVVQRLAARAAAGQGAR